MNPSGYSTNGAVPAIISVNGVIAPVTLSSNDSKQFCGGYYDASIKCMARGASNADNMCMCPGTADSMPYMSANAVDDLAPKLALQHHRGASAMHSNVVGDYLTNQRKPPSWHYEK